MATITVKNEEQTIAFAKEMTNFLTAGMTILLVGDLGAGKTTFTKGLGAGLEIKRMIKSPTYTIIREYKAGKIPLYHIDLYRLSEEETLELGLEEYFDGEGLTVVEWPFVAPEELPNEYLKIELKTNIEEPEERTITLTAIGERYEEVVQKMQLN